MTKRFSVAAGVVLLTSWLSFADEKSAPPPPPAPDPGGSRAVTDPAFDKYVDLDLLQRAWSELNGSLMADVGLQLAEGERILFRPNRVVSADDVLGIAVSIAAESNDAPTLERLQNAARQLGKQPLADRIANVRKLAASSRAPAAATTIVPAHTSVQRYADFQRLLDLTRKAKIANDAKTLDAYGATAKNVQGISEEMRSHLLGSIADARKAIPNDSKADPVVAALSKLQGSSRSWPTAPLLSNSWNSQYVIQSPGQPLQTVNAFITLNGDGTGYYTLDDGSSGQLYNINIGGGGGGPIGPAGAFGHPVINGNWSYGGDSGTFRWNTYANGSAFAGTYWASWGHGPWNGFPAGGNGGGGGGPVGPIGPNGPIGP